MAVINLGSINIDHVYQVDHFVQPGETLASTKYEQLLGGKGANQSIALAQAGSDVIHIGRIAEHDAHIKQTLIRQGIDCRYVQCSDTASGHAIIQVTPQGENCIVLFGGANLEISSKDVLSALSNASRHDWVLTQNETSGIEALLREAKTHDLKVAFNPAPMTEAVRQLPNDCIDLLIVNEGEAAELAGVDELAKIEDYFRENWSHAEIIITLGQYGVKMLRSDGDIHIPAFLVDAVDTTAAGDTFIGYFLSAYSKFADARSALTRACAASALSVTRIGAAQSIPSNEEVDDFLSKQE